MVITKLIAARPTTFIPAPTLRERRHRRLSRRLVAVRGAADLAVVAARPHPLPILRRAGRHEDAADDDAGGHIALMTAPIPVALPLAQGAKVRMLGVTTNDSSARAARDSAPKSQPKRAPVVHCTSEIA
jgi:hypothetical protein